MCLTPGTCLLHCRAPSSDLHSSALRSWQDPHAHLHERMSISTPGSLRGKGHSLRQMELGNLDIHPQKNEARCDTRHIKRSAQNGSIWQLKSSKRKHQVSLHHVDLTIDSFLQQEKDQKERKKKKDEFHQNLTWWYLKSTLPSIKNSQQNLKKNISTSSSQSIVSWYMNNIFNSITRNDLIFFKWSKA